MPKNPQQQKVISKKHLARVERENIQRRWIMISAIVIIVLIVGIIGYGILDQTVLKNYKPVAKVGDQTITTAEFQKEVRFQRWSLIQQYSQGAQIYQMLGNDPNYGAQLQQLQQKLDPLSATVVGEEVLNNMIEKILIEQKAAELKVTVTDKEVDDAMQAAFGYFPQGTPTPTITPVEAATPTLSPLQITLVAQAPTATEVPTTTPTAPAVTPTPTITPTNTTQPTATQIPTITPTPTPYTFQAYQDTIKQNVDRLKDFNFTEADIRAEIRLQILRGKLLDELAKDINREQDQVWVRQILTSDVETANQARKRLMDGEDWTNVASQMSLDETTKNQGGDMGWFAQGVQPVEIDQIAFTIKVGEISSPIKTDAGYHIIQVIAHEVRPLDEGVYQQERQKKFDDWLTTAQQSDQIQKYSWETVVPKEPVIPADQLIDFTGSASGGNIPIP
jgi:parvulin-like peptidyl-prolyl isomerase